MSERSVGAAPVSAAPGGALIQAGIWFALTTGFIEVAVFGSRRFVLGELINRSPDFLWMTPLSYIILFGVPTLLLALIARTWPRVMPFKLGIALLALASAISLLLLFLYQRLHNVALVLLAVGLAVQTARLVGAHPAGFATIVRRTTLPMAALVVLLAIAMPSWRWLSEQRELASLPRAAAGAPNVLLIILDTVRAASLSLYGHDRPTSPALEKWAKRGVVFDRAVATSPWTLPSHGSLFTGRYPHELSADWLTPLDRTYPTLAEVFREGGYRTAAFVANLEYATYEHGLARGFLRYEDYRITLPVILLSSTLGRTLINAKTPRLMLGTDEKLGRKSAAEVNRHFVKWLSSTGDSPFFVFLNYYDAHEPYLPPDSYFKRFAGYDRLDNLSPFRRWALAERKKNVKPEEIRLEMAAYDGAIAYLDEQLDALLTALELRGELDNTLVIVTSDHGEEFAEHGIFYHGHTLYMPALHVPLLILFPGRLPQGVRIAQEVSLRDVAATIQDLIPRRGERRVFPGVSLASVWRDSSAAVRMTTSLSLSEVSKGIRLPEWYPAANGDMSSLVIGESHYVRSRDVHREELYDLKTDPGERHDLAGIGSSSSVLALTRAKMDSLKEESRTRRMAEKKS